MFNHFIQIEILEKLSKLPRKVLGSFKLTFSKHYIVLFLMITILSCQNNNDISLGKLYVVDTVKMDLGYASSAKSTFYYGDSTFFAFADFRTRKKISIFNEEGLLIREIAVKDLMEEVGHRFISMASSSPDTIALLNPYVNQVYLIDENANLLYQKDYSDLFKQNVELGSLINYQHGKAIFTISYHDNLNKTSEEDWIQFYEDSKEFYKILIDTSFYDTVRPILSMNELYNRFIDKGYSALEGTHINYLENSFVFYSSYSDSLYLFNDDGDINKVIGMKSKKYPAKVKALTYEEFHKDEEALRENWVAGSFISEVLWDKYRKLYYVFLKHKMIKDVLPFSILVYDEDFDKLAEIEMSHEKYLLSAMVGKRGLYLLNQTDDWIRSREYTILRYE